MGNGIISYTNCLTILDRSEVSLNVIYLQSTLFLAVRRDSGYVFPPPLRGGILTYCE